MDKRDGPETELENTRLELEAARIELDELNQLLEGKIAHDRLVESSFRMDESRLKALLRINQMVDASVEQLVDFTLEEGIKLTNSQVGYICFLDQEGKVQTFHGRSKIVMSRERVSGGPAPHRVEQMGLWRETARLRRPVVLNDLPAPLHAKGGHSGGQEPVTRHLSIPVFEGTQLAAVAGLVNKRKDYLESDVRQLILLLEGMWQLLRRRRTEAALKESEDKYRSVLEASPDPIAVYNRHGKIILINPAFTIVFGWTSAEVMGQRIDFVPQEERPVTDRAVHILLKEGRCPCFETRRRDKEGRVIPVSLSAAAYRDSSGRRQGIVVTMRDMSGPKQMEAAVRTSEENYRAIFDAVNDAIAVLDYKTGTVLDVNSKLGEMFGYTQPEAKGLNSMVFHVDQPPHTNQRLRDYARKAFHGEPQLFEWPAKTKNGRTFWVEINLKRASIGGRARMLAVIRDITERKSAERELRQERDFIKSLIQTSPAFFAAAGASGKILLLNDAMLKALGYSLEEILQRDYLTTLVPEYERERVAGSFQKLSTSRKSIYSQNHLLTKDGRELLVEWHSSQALMANGDLDYVFGVGIDITEKQKALAALQISEDKYRSVMEAAPDPIVVYGMDGGVTYVNPAFTRVFGWAAEEVLGQSIDYVPGENRKDTQKAITRALREGLTRFETRRYTKDGRLLDVLASAAAYRDHTGELVGMVVDLRDITTRKKMEAALQEAHDKLEIRVQERTAELMEVNEELKSLAYAVSHDLRAPLINLKGFAAELQRAVGIVRAACPALLPGLDEETRAEVSAALEQDIPEAIEFIDASTTRMGRLIKAILNLSRLGHIELSLEKLAMTGLVTEVLKSFAHRLEEKTIKVSLPPLPEIVADRMAMEQIISNIIDNAIKYLVPNRPGEIKIQADRADGRTIFCIRDNGRGIAAEDLDKVFEIFRRVGDQDVPGEGMGLSYVRTLVQRHGGRIWCQSSLGRGSSFLFSVPDQKA
ncbi:MAG: PAS domain S-box protein [Deltaproteobacteria bacterium]|nr:PAS domain S-box protein [Deltaproteobacteria bacterium]